MNRARSGPPDGPASASTNHRCWSEKWFGTMSIVTRILRACASATSASKSASVPKSGSTSHGSATS